MKAGALVTGDGRILWSRGLDSKRAIASITKIMTAIVVIENSEPDEKVKIPEVSRAAGESSAGLKKDERMTRHELLQALMIKSGNDAAMAAALIIGGDVATFVDMMNAKAEDLGLEGTHFKNPHGLDEPGHYSSARDVATMSRYAMSIPEFREVAGTKEVKFVTSLSTHDLMNTNILLISYRGATGVKTGWTGKAGYSVVESAKRDDLEIYAVVLGTNTDLTRFFEARDLMDFGFAHYRKQELTMAGTVMGRSQVTNFLDQSVPVLVSEDTSATVFDIAGEIEQSIDIEDTVAPVKEGQELGSMTFTQNGKLIARVPLVAANDVNKPFFMIQWYYNFVKMWRSVFN
jgi:D-alanyl-D-alanine carboxypeptidase (penicillin-binding protein 5/6)